LAVVSRIGVVGVEETPTVSLSVEGVVVFWWLISSGVSVPSGKLPSAERLVVWETARFSGEWKVGAGAATRCAAARTSELLTAELDCLSS